MNKKFILIFFIAYLAVYTPVNSQTLPFKSFTVEDGLPHSTVYSIVQDSKGFLWLGTQGGLSRFDGLNFENYFVMEETGKGWIWVCFEDSRGVLWFGTNFGGLLRYENDEWTTITTEDGITDNTIRAIYEDEDEALWFGTRNGISILDNGEWRSINTSDGLIDNLVNGFLKDSNGNLWIATDRGLSCFDGEGFTNYNTGNGLLHNTVWNVFQDTDGEIWILNNNGISILSGDNWRYYSLEDGLPGRVKYILKTDDDNYWIATRRGVVNFDGENFKLYSNENGLAGTIVQCLYKDNEDNIWVGVRGGISRLASTLSTVSFTKQDGLVSNIVTSILEDSRNNIWFSTSEGLSRFDGRNWRSFQTVNGESIGNVRCSFKDSGGNLWFGNSGGVFKYNSRSWNRIRIGLLAQNVVNDIDEDSGGNLWFATRGGVAKYDGRNFTYFTEEDGIGSNVVRSLLITTDGIIWCATRKGISKFEDGIWTTLTTDDGLAGNNTNSIYRDSENNLWIGTRNGVSRYNGSTFTNFSMKDGLSSNICLYCIEENGYIYIGTNNGLNKFVENSIVRVYGEKDGFPSSVMNQESALRDAEGNIWLGTINGAVKFNPSKEKPLLDPPPVYIKSVSLFQDEIDTAVKNPFNYKQNNFRFNFIGICLSAPEDVSYKYILEGINEDWITTDQNTLEFAQLPPNRYTFKVHAKNADGIWSASPAEFSFVITPPFWSTVWFRLSAVLMIFALIYLRLYNLKKSNVELESRVSKRTQELEIKITELKESSNKIKTLEGLLPICCNCKKIKLEGKEGEDQKDWIAIEAYLKSRTEADFSHGICPECKKDLYPNL